MALQVLNASDLAAQKPAEHENLLRLIWKRCIVQDDWTSLVQRADGMSDEDMAQMLADTTLCGTLKEGKLLGMPALLLHTVYVHANQIVQGSWTHRLPSSQYRRAPHCTHARNLQISHHASPTRNLQTVSRVITQPTTPFSNQRCRAGRVEEELR